MTGQLWIRMLLFLGVVAVALGGVLLFAVRMIARDRDGLLQGFASDRAHQMDEALVEIESDLTAISDDLVLAARLAASADSAKDRERELAALVGVVRQYHIVQACTQQDPRLARVVSAGAEFAAASAPLATALDQTCRLALGASDTVHTSPSVVVDGRALRIFARASTGIAPPVAAALVVDTAQVLTRLRIVSADPGTRLIILGGGGGISRFTGPDLAGVFGRVNADPGVAPTLAILLERLRRHERGTLRIPAREAALLGLGDETAMAIYRPIHAGGADPWSTAMISSTATVAAHERALFRRMLLSVVLIAVMLAAMSAFVIFTTRRTIALRERLRRADEIAHLHEKAEKVLETIPTGVIALAGDGTVTAVNAVLRGRTDDFPPGTRFADVFDQAEPAAVEQIDALVRGAREGGTTRSLFGEALSLFGDEGSYNVHAVPLASSFPDASALVVIEDLSMIGSLERQLLRSERLATLGILAAGIAHEIGTPLGIARGRAEYTLGKRGTPEVSVPAAQIIIEQIDHISRTIRKLLDFSRVDPARVVSAVDLAATTRNVADLLALEARRRKIVIRIDVPEAVTAVAADADQLEQVLVNLMMNAFDACEAGGTIEIAAAPASVVGDVVRIIVSDDGRGIPDADRDLVFDPFFTTKKRGQGTGLGLSIVAQIVRNHGGTIELETVPGQGTRVVLMWPAVRVAEVRSGHAR